MRQITVLVLLSFLNAQPARSGSKAKGAPAIGFIRDASEFEDAGGCALWLAGDRSNDRHRNIFLSDLDERAVINIDGRDVPLNLRNSVGENAVKKGQRSTYKYSGDNTEAVVEYVITFVCAPDDEKCEVFGYDARITVTTRSGKQVVQAHGICGS